MADTTGLAGATGPQAHEGAGAGARTSSGAGAGWGRPARPSLFQLTCVVGEAFGRFERRRALGRLGLRTATLVALLVYERRVHPGGRALCLLGPRWPRVAGGAGAVVVFAGVAGAFSATAAVAVLVAVVAVFLPLAVNGLWALPARLRLARRAEGPGLASPRAATLGTYLHSLASTEPGAGAELLGAVCAEADAKGWQLVLDAGALCLVDYYERFGFEPFGTPVRFPHGRYQVRMRRCPRGGVPLPDSRGVVGGAVVGGSPAKPRSVLPGRLGPVWSEAGPRRTNEGPRSAATGLPPVPSRDRLEKEGKQ